MTDISDVAVLVIVGITLAAHVMALWRMWAHVERSSRLGEERVHLLLDILERTVERVTSSPLADLHSSERKAVHGCSQGTPREPPGVIPVPPEGISSFIDEAPSPEDRIEYNLSR